MYDLASNCHYRNATGMNMMASPMRQCICKNTSFNVSSIAALCASCLDENGRPMGAGMGNMMGMMGSGSGMDWAGKFP